MAQIEDFRFMVVGSPKEYFSQLPLIRAVACFLVVVVHVTAVAYEAGADRFHDDFSKFLNQYARYGTPLFAVMSGFLLFNNSVGRALNIGHYVRFRILRIGIPFVLWSVFYIALLPRKAELLNHSVASFVYSFFTGGMFYHLYFFSTVLQFYIVFPALYLMGFDRRLWFFLLAMAYGVNYFWVSGQAGEVFGCAQLGGVLCDRAFLLNWIGYFVLGGVVFLFFNEISEFASRNTLLVWSLMLLVILATGVEIAGGAIFSSSRPENFVYVPIFGVFLLSFFEKMKRWVRAEAAIRTVGDLSFGIYLVHPAVLVVLRKVLPVQFFGGVGLVAVIALTLAGSIIVSILVSKVPFSNYILPLPRKSGA